MMESADSSSGSQHPQLPPGFRFHPTDEELVVHYLKKKAASAPLPVTIIAEVDLYKFDPWELPSKAMFGEHEWYFFSPRDRKYPNGARPNRAATSGYWKATGTDKPILTAQGCQKVGVKKALVFYGGKPPKGIKTNWIMHEYRLIDSKYSVNNIVKPHPVYAANKKASLRLDDWVLCRIYKKNNPQQQQTQMDRDMNGDNHSIDGMFSSPKPPGLKTVTGYDVNTNSNENLNFFEGILSEHQLGGNGNGSSKHPNPSTTSLNTANFVPAIKRTSSHQYWNETASVGSSSGKRFHGELNGGGAAADDQESNSFVSLLNQLPPHQGHAGNSGPFHHPNSLLGSLGDGVLRHQQFQLPNLNWNS